MVPLIDARIPWPEAAEAAGGPGGDEFAFAGGFFVLAAFVEMAHESAVHGAHEEAARRVDGGRDAPLAYFVAVPDGEVAGFDFLLVINELDAVHGDEVAVFEYAGDEVFQGEGGQAEEFGAFAQNIFVQPFVMVAEFVDDAGLGKFLPEPAEELAGEIEFFFDAAFCRVFIKAGEAEKIADIAIEEDAIGRARGGEFHGGHDGGGVVERDVEIGEDEGFGGVKNERVVAGGITMRELPDMPGRLVGAE